MTSAGASRAGGHAVRPVGKVGTGTGGEEEEETSAEDGRQEESIGEEREAMGPESGERKPERMADPRLPGKAEVEEHRKMHLPYRSWCKHCVRGRGTEEPHRKQKGEVGIPEVHMDFLFLGDEGTNEKSNECKSSR